MNPTQKEVAQAVVTIFEMISRIVHIARQYELTREEFMRMTGDLWDSIESQTKGDPQ